MASPSSRTHFFLKTNLALLSFLFLLLTCTGSTTNDPSSSADKPTAPIVIINTAAELQAITNNIVTLNSISYNADGTNNTGATGKHIAGNYQLAGNIDLSEMTDFTPIGSKTIPFIGVFDGKGYEVTLNINSTKSYVGLFGYVGINEAYTDNTTAVSNRNNAIEIKDIGISGTVTSTGDNVGGLVGRVNRGSIAGYSEATVSGNDSVGGLVGYNKGGTILGYATGDVSGTYSYGNTGGLVGYNKDGNILGYATGNVSSSGYFTGGLVGYINLNTVTLNITGYATGNVSGTTFAGGGLLGGTGAEISSIVVTGYATGAVTGSGSGNRIKGFIGTGKSASISARNSYFDATSTGQTDSYTTSISAATNIYKFAGPTETSGRTIGKFYDKATGISPTAEDSGDTEIFTAQGFIDAFDLANTPNGKFPKLKTSLFGSFTQP